MNKKTKLKALLSQALRLLEEEDNYWHLYFYTQEAPEEGSDELAFIITACFEPPGAGDRVERSIVAKVSSSWELEMTALHLALDLYTSQPIMPVDEPLTVHVNSQEAMTFLSNAGSHCKDINEWLETQAVEEIDKAVARLVAFLINLLPEVKIEME